MPNFEEQLHALESKSWANPMLKAIEQLKLVMAEYIENETPEKLIHQLLEKYGKDRIQKALDNA